MKSNYTYTGPSSQGRKIKSKEILSKIENTQSGRSYLFYALIGGAAVGILGGLYYLYTLMTKEEEFSEEQQVEVEEIRQQIQENNGELSTDIAIKILAQINKRVEEIMKVTKPELDEKRRLVMNNYKEYNKQCGEFFSLKEAAYNKATNQILNNFNMKISDLKEIMDQITPHEVEKKIFIYHKPYFTDNIIPDRETVKEAFIFFGNKFIDEMSNFNTECLKTEEKNQDVIIFKMLVIKLKIDDCLYLKFKMNENQIRYLIFEYSLLEDKEVKTLNDKISKYEEVLYL